MNSETPVPWDDILRESDYNTLMQQQHAAANESGTNFTQIDADVITRNSRYCIHVVVTQQNGL
jgi:hypothetical protein